MNLRHMEVFRAIMLTGSITAAGRLLHISPSAVSKLISHAQQRTGLKLFELVKGRLVATSEAHQLYAEIEHLWRNVEKVHALSRELSNPDKGNLCIAASPSLGPTVVPHSVADTVRERPDLRVKVILPLTQALLDAVADKSVDIGITTFAVNHPNISVHARFHCPLVCIMHSAHPLAAREVIYPQDLIGHRLISVPLHDLYGLSEESVYGQALSKLDIGLEVRSGLIASLFSRASGEIAVVDAIAISDHLIPELIVRPFMTPQRIHIAVIHNSYKPLSPQALLFRHLLMQRLQSFSDQEAAHY